jgi:hypothetical protein
MRHSTCRAAFVALGLLTFALNTSARCDEASNRDSVIQGVRDDVRRKIQERSEVPSATRPESEVASEAKQPTSTPAQDSPKQDTPK